MITQPRNMLLIALVTLLSPGLGRSAAPLTGEPVDCVNPLSGTNGDSEFSRGNTLAAIVAPFGMTTWAPQTDGNASPFYQMKHRRFEGIRATHQPSVWVRDYGDFLIMPIVGAGDGSERDRSSPFSHDRETARPYYYAVELERYGVRLELTPTERCALMRLTFPAAQDAAVVFSGEVEFDAAADLQKRTIRGKATHVTFGAPRDFGMYFVAEFSQPLETMEVRRDDKRATAVVRLKAVDPDTPALMRIGTSFISYEQAELNLSRELPDWDFEQAMAKARQAWSRELAVVNIKGATPEQRSTFYTALYRVLQFPRMFHEPDASGKLHHYSPFAD